MRRGLVPQLAIGFYCCWRSAVLEEGHSRSVGTEGGAGRAWTVAFESPSNQLWMTSLVPGEQFQLDLDEFLIGLQRGGSRSVRDDFTSSLSHPRKRRFGPFDLGWSVVVGWECQFWRPFDWGGSWHRRKGDCHRRHSVAKTMTKQVSNERKQPPFPSRAPLLSLAASASLVFCSRSRIWN